jgi:hypothetical protein
MKITGVMMETSDYISIHAKNADAMIILDPNLIRTKIGIVAKETENYAQYGIKNAIVIK